MWFEVFVFLAVVTVDINCLENDDDDIIDDLSDIVDLLFDENDKYVIDDVFDDIPIFENNRWLCGECKNLDGNQIIYTETEEFINYNQDSSSEVQIGIGVDGMRCITIEAPNMKSDDLDVNIGAGSCNGQYVTLILRPKLYGEYNVEVYAYGY